MQQNICINGKVAMGANEATSLIFHLAAKI
jgi:hypothetical protein